MGYGKKFASGCLSNPITLGVMRYGAACSNISPKPRYDAALYGTLPLNGKFFEPLCMRRVIRTGRVGWVYFAFETRFVVVKILNLCINYIIKHKLFITGLYTILVTSSKIKFGNRIYPGKIFLYLRHPKKIPVLNTQGQFVVYVH